MQPKNLAVAGIATIALMAAASSAAAAPAAYDWTGVYAGVDVGGGWSRMDFQPIHDNVSQLSNVFVQGLGTVIVPGTSIDVPKAKLSSSGFVYGAHGGFDYQIGDNIVVGMVADISSGVPANTLTITGTLPQTVLTQPAPYTLVRREDERWHASVRARVGVVTNRVLLYATGGVAFDDLKITTRDTVTLTGPNPALPNPIVSNSGLAAQPVNLTSAITTGESRQNRRGWTLGGGAEWAWRDNVHFGIEYRHEDFGTKAVNYRLNAPILGTTTNAGYDVPGANGERSSFSEDRLTMSVNYHWGL